MIKVIKQLNISDDANVETLSMSRFARDANKIADAAAAWYDAHACRPDTDDARMDAERCGLLRYYGIDKPTRARVKSYLRCLALNIHRLATLRGDDTLRATGLYKTDCGAVFAALKIEAYDSWLHNGHAEPIKYWPIRGGLPISKGIKDDESLYSPV